MGRKAVNVCGICQPHNHKSCAPHTADSGGGPRGEHLISLYTCVLFLYVGRSLFKNLLKLK